MREVLRRLSLLAAMAVAACGQQTPGPAGPPGPPGPAGPRGDAGAPGRVIQVAGSQSITYTLLAAGRFESGAVRVGFNGLRSVALQDGGKRALLTFDGARNPAADHHAIVLTQDIGATAPLLGSCTGAEWPFTVHASVVGESGFVISMTDKTGRVVDLACSNVWLEVFELSGTN